MNTLATVQSITLLNKGTTLYPHTNAVTRKDRNRHFYHKSGVVWLTGLSGSGKSTIANLVEKQLFEEGFLVSVLDGDTLRCGLNSDLGFSVVDRNENLRRAAEVAAIMADAGHIVLASFISPHHCGRRLAQKVVSNNFHLVYVQASFEECRARDPKGLYMKAQEGKINNFTGVGQDYQVPVSPDLTIDTTSGNETECSEQLMEFIIQRYSL